ncbi:MAG: hypothetical protein H6Q88_3699 [Anaeromyxobacteraceae bacterium]|nr:hypothetical protein [Anaeromyxobacteraceae bacterium]
MLTMMSSLGMRISLPSLSSRTSASETYFTCDGRSMVSCPASASAFSFVRLASRARPSSAPRYESVTVAVPSSAMAMAASSAESPPPTTSTFRPAYCSASVNP